VITIGHFYEGTLHEPVQVEVWKPIVDDLERPLVRLNVRPVTPSQCLSTLVKLTPKEALDLARDLIAVARAARG
jgi:hypothetical protein